MSSFDNLLFFATDFFPKGNLLPVIFFGERVNFHAVWDDGMIDKYCNANWTSLAEEVSGQGGGEGGKGRDFVLSLPSFSDSKK